MVPPPGYELAYAVGTTYSLDLEALVVLPVALFYAQSLDATPGEIRYDMLEAITQAADKISIFCQKGKIQVPRKYHYLIAFWEKGIEQVLMPDGYSSFHPKVWVIRYEAPGRPACYRVLVTSRNLTFARDWDIAFSTEGTVGKDKQEETQPLAGFLRYLETTSKREFPAGFLKDLEKVKFDIPAGFERLNFYPIGTPLPAKRKLSSPGQDDRYVNPLATVAWKELLVISPFVDEKTVEDLARLSRRKLTILSRKEELDTLELSTLQGLKSYQFSKLLEGAETDESLSEAGIGEPCLQSLHAKVYIGEQRGDQGKTYHWFLGSANCTDPAASGRNVEFLVELKGTGYKQRPGEIIDLLTDNGKSEVALFEPYDPEKRVSEMERKEQERAIRVLVYELTKVPISGHVSQVAGGTAYELSLEVDASGLKVQPGYGVRIKPLPEKNKAAFIIEPGKVNPILDYFRGYEERQLSPFLLWEIWFEGACLRQFLVQIPLELPETRLNKIFTFFIDNRDKFLRYLTFLLSGETPEVIPFTDEPEEKGAEPRQGDGSNGSFLPGVPVFEKLLLAASRSPQKLRSIDHLISRLKAEESGEGSDPIVSGEFESLWDVFKVYLEKSKI